MEKGEFKKKFMVHNSPKFEEKLISRQFFAQVIEFFFCRTLATFIRKIFQND